jgi:hypothetical protein
MSFPLEPNEVPEAGDFVHLNASKNVVRTVAADPTPILGLTEEKYNSIIKNFILVTVADGDTVFAMEGSRAPLATDVDVDYGIARDANGVWTVDATDTTNTRVKVVDVDTTRNLWFVKILPANRQFESD